MKRSWAVGLALLAAANVGAGVWLALNSLSFGADVRQIGDWGGLWTHHGNPYVFAGWRVDYPPWAIVLLSPLSWIAPDSRVSVWCAVSVALAALLAWRLAGLSGESRDARVNLALLFMATACLRSFGQLSVLSYLLAILGAAVSQPIVGGVLIGLALFKPQIGGAILVWALITRDWRRSITAIIVPLALTIVFAAVARIHPWAVIHQYLTVLDSLYAAPTAMAGHTELRPWLWTVVPAVGPNLALGVVLAGCLIAPAIVSVARFGAPSGDRTLELIALCGVASLLTVRHLSYDFVLVLPALVAWRRPPFSAAAHAPTWLFFGLSAALVLALPSWVRLAVSHGAPAGWLVLTQLDRVLCITVWAIVAWRVTAARAGRAR